MRHLLTLLFFSLSAFCATAQGNAQWIADAPVGSAANTTLYSLCSDGKPTILAVGNYHSQATEGLLQTNTLQKLAREHAAPKSGTSMGDLHVAFLNITVFPNDDVAGNPSSVAVYNLPESSDALNAEGWKDLYSITETKLFILTADHLIYPLQGGNADEIYAAAKGTESKLRPSGSADVRLLSVRNSEDGKDALITVQNYSTTTLPNVHIAIRDAVRNIVLAEKDVVVSLASLAGATIPLTLESGISNRNIEVVASVAGDVNQTNNVWRGRLQSVDGTMVAATGLSK